MANAYILMSREFHFNEAVSGWEKIEGVFSSKARAKAAWARIAKEGEQKGATVLEYLSMVHHGFILSVENDNGWEKRYKIITEEMNNA